jgi:hypothetical protein
LHSPLKPHFSPGPATAVCTNAFEAGAESRAADTKPRRIVVFFMRFTVS